MKRALGETAIGPGDDVVAPDQASEPHDALGDQFRVFDDVGGVADHAWNEHLAGGKFRAFPDAPFVLVARIGTLDDEGANLHAQDQVDNVLERDVGRMRTRPASPADVIADAIGWQTGDGLVENLDLQREPVAVIGK
jgi:hypothetical protein